MARIRSVHPDICVSEVMASLPSDLERTFVRLWTHCDDDGRCLDNPKLIKAALYPLTDGMTAARVEKELAALQAVGLILRYSVNGTRVLAVTSWSEYQHPQRPSKSKLPAFDTSGVVHEPSANTQRALHAGVGEGEGTGEGEGDIAPTSGARKRDYLWESLLEACGVTADRITGSGRGAYNRACSDLRKVGATPDEVHQRSVVYREKWPGTSCTPSALTKHWAELEPSRQIIEPSEGTRNVMRLRAMREQGHVG